MIMVRETRHLWIGNLPENVREEQIRDLFQRHGRVQSVKLLSEDCSSGVSNSSNSGRNGGKNATVSFIDIRSAAKAFRAVNALEGKNLDISYHEPSSVPSRGRLQPLDHPTSSSPSRTDEAIVNSENGNNNPLPTLQAGSSTLGVVGVSNGGGVGTGPPGPGNYRQQQRFPPQHAQSEDSSSHFYEQPKGFSRGRGDGHGFHGGRGRRDHRHYNNRHSSFPMESRNNYRWGYPNEGRFAPPAHSETDERTSVPPPITHPPPSETGSKGPRRPDSPASSVSSRHVPSKKHKSRSVSESGSSEGSSHGSRSRSGSRSSVSTSMSSGRSRSPPHHGSSGHYSRGSTSGGRFQQNSYSRQRYSRSRLVSRPADSSRARHSSRSSPVGAASPSSSTSSSPSPHRKITTNPHSPSHSPSSAKSYSPSRSVNPASTGHRHQHSNHRKAPTNAELLSSLKIKNLPSRSSDSSLKDGLYHEYKKHGKLAWVRISGSGPERYATVCFKSPEHMASAVASSQDKLFFGSKIIVTPCITPGSRADSLTGADEENRAMGEDEPTSVASPTRTLLINGLDPAVTQEELRQALDNFGDIVTIDIRKSVTNTQALCEFVDISSAVRAQWGRFVFKSREAKISFCRNNAMSSLILDGTSGLTEKQLFSLCSKHGNVESIISDPERLLALVHFDEISSAQAALRDIRSSASKGRTLQADNASVACVRTFLNRIPNGMSESLPQSPSHLNDSLSPPVLNNPSMTKDSSNAIRRLHHKNLNSMGERRILSRQNEFDLNIVKQNAQIRNYKDGLVEIGINSHQRFNGPENQYNSSGSRRRRERDYVSPVSPALDNVIVNGDRRTERIDHSQSNSRIDLSCHETGSSITSSPPHEIVTSSSDVIPIPVENESPDDSTHNVVVLNHRGAGFPDFSNCDVRQLNTVESAQNQNLINRKLNVWSKSQSTIVTMDGVSSTSPEPKNDAVRKVSPDPGIGMSGFEPSSQSPAVCTVITEQRTNFTLPQRSSVDSGGVSPASGSIPASSPSTSSITTCSIPPIENVPETAEDDLDDRPGTPLCDENPESFPSSDPTPLHTPTTNTQASVAPHYDGFDRNNRGGNNNMSQGSSNTNRPTNTDHEPRTSLQNPVIETPKLIEVDKGRETKSVVNLNESDGVTPERNSINPNESSTCSPVPESSPLTSLALDSPHASSESIDVPKTSTPVSTLSPVERVEPDVFNSCGASPQELSKPTRDATGEAKNKLTSTVSRPLSPDSRSSDSDESPTKDDSLDRQMKSFFERYDQWEGVGSRNAAARPPLLPRPPIRAADPVNDKSSLGLSLSTMSSGIGISEADTEISASLSSANSRPWFVRSRVPDLNELRQQPSERVKSILARSSVFDDDLKRLEEKEKLKNLDDANSWRSVASRSSSTSSAPVSSMGFSLGEHSSSIPLSAPTTPSSPLISPFAAPRSSFHPTHPIRSDLTSTPTFATARNVHLNAPPPSKLKDLNLSTPSPAPHISLTSYPSSGQQRPKVETPNRTPGKPNPLLSPGTTPSLPVAATPLFIKPSTLLKSPTEMPKSAEHSTSAAFKHGSSGPTIERSPSQSHENHMRVPGSSMLAQKLSIHPHLPPHGHGSSKLPSPPIQSGIHHGIPRMVERSMSLDSKRNTPPGVAPRIPTVTPNIPNTVLTNSALSTYGNSSDNVNMGLNANGSSTQLQQNRRTSVDSSAHVPVRLIGNSIPAVQPSPAKDKDNGPTALSKRSASESEALKKKITNMRPVKDVQKPTPSLTIVSDTHHKKDDIKSSKIGRLVKDDSVRLDMQHLQEPTVTVVASVHSSKSSGKSKDGKDGKSSSRRDKDPTKSKKVKVPDNIKPSESQVSITSKSGKERKLSGKSASLEVATPVQNEKGKPEAIVNHVGSGSRHDSNDNRKRKEKEGKPKVKEPELAVPTTPISAVTSAAATSTHKVVEDVGSKNKRRLSSQDISQGSTEESKKIKKLKLDKEKHSEKEKVTTEKSETVTCPDAAPVVQASHHHHHRNNSSTSERRESKDLGSKEKISREKSLEKVKPAEKFEIISQPVKEKSEHHHHHRSKSSSGSCKHHHRDKDKTTSHTSSKEKEKLKSETKEKDPTKENYAAKEPSSTSSTKHSSVSNHSHARHSSHHKKDKTKENGSTSSVPGSSTSSSKIKGKDKEVKTNKEKLISTSSSLLTTSVDSDPFEMLDETVKVSASTDKEKTKSRDSSKSSKRDRHKSGGEKSRASSPAGANTSSKNSRSRPKEPKKKRRFVLDDSDSPNNDTDDDDDEDKQKHHSIFEVVVDEYVSMYDKVKARSNRACKNNATAKQQKEEQRKQEKLQESFQQLKKSRAKREEKKRSTSIDERKSLRNSSSEDEDSQNDSEVEHVSTKRPSFEQIKRGSMAKSIISSDDAESAPVHVSASKTKAVSQAKVKNHSKRDTLTKKPSSLSSTIFSSQWDEDSSQGLQPPVSKKRKLGVKHQRERDSSSLILNRSKSDSDDSDSDVGREKVRHMSGSMQSSGNKLKKTPKTYSRPIPALATGAGIYSESDSSSKHSQGQEVHALSASSSSKTPSIPHTSKSKKDKASKKKKNIDAIKKSLFDSSDSSGDEKIVVKKNIEKSRASKDRENKSRNKKKSSHRNKSSSSLSKMLSGGSKKEGQRDRELAKRESTMEVLLFGAMSSTSDSENDHIVKDSKGLVDKPKVLTPPVQQLVSAPLNYPETPVSHKKPKSKSGSHRKSSEKSRTEEEITVNNNRSKILANSATPVLKAAAESVKLSSAEKKKRRHEKKLAKRSEHKTTSVSSIWSDKVSQAKVEPSVKYDSLFNSPITSPTERQNKPSEKRESELSASCFGSVPKLFPLPKLSPTISAPTIAEVAREKDTVEIRFSTDEDDDDDNRLKIDISEAIMASDETEESQIPEPETSAENLVILSEPIDEVALAAAAAEKKKLEEEEKKRHCLFEQDKAIESILTERKSPSRTSGLGQTPGISTIISTDVDVDEREPKDDAPKDNTAISQEETEDAVAALLETLDRDDGEDENLNEKLVGQRSPPTLRIIEESPASSLCGDKELGNGSSPWYSGSKSPQNELQIDEGDPKSVLVDMRKSSTESINEIGTGAPLAEEVENTLEKQSGKRTSPRRGTRSRQGSSDGANSSADVYEFHDDSDEDRVRKISPSPLLHSRLNITPTSTPAPAVTPPALKSPTPEVADIPAVSQTPEIVVPTCEPTIITKPPLSSPQTVINIPQAPPVLQAGQSSPPIAPTGSAPAEIQPQQVPTSQMAQVVLVSSSPVQTMEAAHQVPIPVTPMIPNLGMPVVQTTLPTHSPSPVIYGLTSGVSPLKPLTIDCPQLQKPLSVLSMSPVINKFPPGPVQTLVAPPQPSHSPWNTVNDTIELVIRMASNADSSPPPPITAPVVESDILVPTSKPLPGVPARGRSRSKSKDTPEEISSVTATINRVAMSTPSPHRGSTPISVIHHDIVETALQQSHNQTKLNLPMIETRTDSHGPRFATQREPSTGLQTLIDPTTGDLIPMIRQSDEGQYVPAQADKEQHQQMHQMAHVIQQYPNKYQKVYEMDRSTTHDKPTRMIRPEGLPAMLAHQQIFQQQPQQHFRPQNIQQFQGQKQMATTSSLSPGISQRSGNMYSQVPYHSNLGQSISGQGTPPPQPNAGMIATSKTTPPGQSKGPSGMYSPMPPQSQGHMPMQYPMTDGRGQIQMMGRMPTQQPLLRPGQSGPPPPSSPQLLTALPSQQLVRIPQIPSATTITKVDSRSEEQQGRKVSIIHPNVIVTTTNGSSPVIHSHPLQPRMHESFAQAPRVEISGNLVPMAAGSPQAGRQSSDHIQQQSGQQRSHQGHHKTYDPVAMGDVRSMQPNLRAPHDSAHFMPPQSSHQQVVHPYHYIPISLAGGTGGGNLPPDSNRQPSPVFAVRPGSVPADTGSGKATHQLDGNKQMLERPMTSHLIPTHLVSPHLVPPPGGDRSSESPHLVPHSLYAPRQSPLYAGHPASGIPPAHHNMRQTFMHPFDFEEPPFSHASAYHISAVGERERERDVGAEEAAYVLSQISSSRRVTSSSPPPAHSSRFAAPGLHNFSVNGNRPSDRDNEAALLPLQGDASLITILQRYPIMWTGQLVLKNESAACQIHFVSGNINVAKESFPSQPEGSSPALKISQRMRLEPTQLDGVSRKMQMEPEHCMLLALPCGNDQLDVLHQSNNLRNSFITYLQLKQAAGIVNVHHPDTQLPAHVIHIFPACDFANENLARIAPDLLNGVADIAHLVIVIATV